VSQEVEVINGSTAIGYFSSEKKHEQYTFGEFLYLPYINWCKREKNSSVNPKGFAQSVLDVSKDLGIKAEKKLTQSGIIIQGIGIKDKVKNFKLYTGRRSGYMLVKPVNSFHINSE
jgi:hypothetical protein